MPIQELIKEYCEQAAICSAVDYTDKKSVKASNNAIGRMYTIVDTIVSDFGVDGANKFSSLLDSTDHAVNIWAAAHLLEKMKADSVAEEKALTIIKNVAKQDDVEGLGFRHWLENWEKKTDNMKDDALFCVGQKAFIEKDGKVLVLFDPTEGLDFPGGKIQEGEAKDADASSLVLALQREVREETNLEVKVFNPFAVWYHEFPKESRNYPKVVYLVAFRSKYVSGEIVLSDEHNNFRWVDKSNYKEVDDGSDYFDVLEKYFVE